MLKIKLADNTEIEVLEDTTVFPSGSSSMRSKMSVHVATDAMDLVAFEHLMSDAEKTKEIHLISENPETREIISDVAYTHYSILASIGKKRVDTTSYVDGKVTSAMHLVAELEQLTYIEQQLAAMGVQL